jgi:hypothetical protein
MSALTVLSRDPFTADGTGGNTDSNGRLGGAEWYAEQVHNQLEIPPEAHQRRIHYKIISQDPPIQMLNGEPYINTEQCEGVLERTSLDARYLGLVPPLVDRRNPAPVINLDDAEADDGVITANTYDKEGELQSYSTSVPEIVRPRLRIFEPTILQRYHLEIMFEKSTMNDVLMPLGERYGININTAAGEFSHTNCVDLLARARASGKPFRILRPRRRTRTMLIGLSPTKAMRTMIRYSTPRATTSRKSTATRSIRAKRSRRSREG